MVVLLIVTTLVVSQLIGGRAHVDAGSQFAQETNAEVIGRYVYYCYCYCYTCVDVCVRVMIVEKLAICFVVCFVRFVSFCVGWMLLCVCVCLVRLCDRADCWLVCWQCCCSCVCWVVAL